MREVGGVQKAVVDGDAIGHAVGVAVADLEIGVQQAPAVAVPFLPVVARLVPAVGREDGPVAVDGHRGDAHRHMAVGRWRQARIADGGHVLVAPGVAHQPQLVGARRRLDERVAEPVPFLLVPAGLHGAELPERPHQVALRAVDAGADGRVARERKRQVPRKAGAVDVDLRHVPSGQPAGVDAGVPDAGDDELHALRLGGAIEGDFFVGPAGDVVQFPLQFPALADRMGRGEDQQVARPLLSRRGHGRVPDRLDHARSAERDHDAGRPGGELLQVGVPGFVT